jgi:hypothetical protein
MTHSKRREIVRTKTNQQSEAGSASCTLPKKHQKEKKICRPYKQAPESIGRRNRTPSTEEA